MTDFFFTVEEFDQYLKSQMVIQEPKTLYEPMNYATVTGGKRIRAALTVTGSQIAGVRKEEMYPLALAIELLHAFSLVHDDIMDNSDMRRGQPSVMKKYGTNQAILSGDALLIKAYQSLSETKTPYLSKTLKTFSDVALEICEGQALDMQLENETLIDKATYLKMIGKKTAVLLATSLSIGGIAAGCTSQTEEMLYKIGYDMGMAFQIQDDWLDCFGTEETGKTLYTDILNCKNNYLYVMACEQLRGSQLNEFISLYSQKSGGESKVSQVKQVYSQLNIEHSVSEEINQYHQQCYHHIKKLNNTNSNALKQLQQMIEMMVGRRK